MTDIEAKITGANISLVFPIKGRMEKFGSFSLMFKCECGKLNNPFILYKGKEKTSENYMCIDCKKEYEIGNPIQISYYVKEKE